MTEPPAEAPLISPAWLRRYIYTPAGGAERSSRVRRPYDPMPGCRAALAALACLLLGPHPHPTKAQGREEGPPPGFPAGGAFLTSAEGMARWRRASAQA